MTIETTQTETEGRFRVFGGALGAIQKILAIALPVVGIGYILHIPTYLGTAPYVQQYAGFFMGIALILAFLSVPASSKSSTKRLPWYDAVLAVAGGVSCFYVVVFYPQIIFELGSTPLPRVLLGIVAVVAVLEGTRRSVGWALVITVLLFIFYAHFSYLFPGPLYGQGFSWSRIFSYSYLGADALFGMALQISSTTVLAFILFGQFLSRTGGGDFLIDLAQTLMGRYRGGPAKVAVLASAFFGSISGSAVANVASTGAVTIPLMKKTGYEPSFAGAVEATASSGGTILPPVMAAAAFLMAQFLGIPYAEVALAAAIPGILYYVGVYVQVDLRAAKTGLKGIDPASLPPITKTFADGWIFLVPMFVLVYDLLVRRDTAELSALYSIATMLILTLLKKETRSAWLKTISILESTGWAMLELAVLSGAAGFVIGLVSVTGLGFAIPQTLTAVTGGNLLLLLVLTAIASIILGMGLPITASYVLLALIATPAMIKLGVLPIAAHLFVLYFGAMSFLTPPVCLAAYTGAAIAGAPMLRTALQAMKLAVAAYIVPFVFIYHTSLLLIGSAGSIIYAVVNAIIAIIALGIGLEGFFVRKLDPVMQALFLVSGIMIIIPETTTDIIGFILLAILVCWELQLSLRNRVHKAEQM